MNNCVCNNCNKTYSSLKSLNNHKRKYHKDEEIKKYKCNYCDKSYVFRESKYKHQKTCKNNPIIINNINNTNNTNNNIVNNNQNNNNYNVIINFNSQEDRESPTKYFTNEDKIKISKLPFYEIIPKIVELKYCNNNKYGQMKNVKITNLNNKYALVYKNKKFEVVTKEYAINNLIHNCYWVYVEIYENLENIPEYARKQFEKFVEHFEYYEENEDNDKNIFVDNVIYKNMNEYNKTRILLLIYNNGI